MDLCIDCNYQLLLTIICQNHTIHV
jgi:hypothetical protein